MYDKKKGLFEMYLTDVAGIFFRPGAVSSVEQDILTPQADDPALSAVLIIR